MKNLFEQSRSHWVRYDHYELKTAEDGKRYITPGKNAKPDVYNPLKGSQHCTGCAECGDADDGAQTGGRGGKSSDGVCHPVRPAGVDDRPAHHTDLYGLRGGLPAEKPLYQGRIHGDGPISVPVLPL